MATASSAATTGNDTALTDRGLYAWLLAIYLCPASRSALTLQPQRHAVRQRQRHQHAEVRALPQHADECLGAPDPEPGRRAGHHEPDLRRQGDGLLCDVRRGRQGHRVQQDAGQAGHHQPRRPAVRLHQARRGGRAERHRDHRRQGDHELLQLPQVLGGRAAAAADAAAQRGRAHALVPHQAGEPHAADGLRHLLHQSARRRR